MSFTCADADRLSAFYHDAFGFAPLDVCSYRGPEFSRLIGIDEAEARAVRLCLGKQIIELLAFAKPGMPYPAEHASNDLRFQHIAIVTSNMNASYARLLEHSGWSPISTSGPQRLPQSSGGVTAFKFRDPEGHPLELLSFPQSHVPPRWQVPAANDGSCLGIDHSAIVVASTAKSIHFYASIGFSLGSRSVNRGDEQHRLDSVPDPVVEVTALNPEPIGAPHLELLCYLAPGPHPSKPPAPCSNDVAATRLVIEVDDFAAIEQKLASLPVRPISAAAVTLEYGRPAALARDPDGHALLLLGR